MTRTMVPTNEQAKAALLGMDAQHRELLDALERFDTAREAPERRLGELIGLLEKHAREHFAHEERTMAETHYPDAPGHIALHTLVRARVAALRERFQAEGATGAVMDAVRETIGAMLHDQMVSHDRALKHFLTSRN